MNYQTYLFFEGRTEYIQGYDTPQHTYPLGSLVFGVLDLDAAPYLERGRALLEKFRGVKFPVLASGDRDHILSGVFNQFLSEKSEPAE